MGRIRGPLVHEINFVRAKSHFQNDLVTSQPWETDLETKRLVQENELDRNDMKCYATTDSGLYETGSEYSS